MQKVYVHSCPLQPVLPKQLEDDTLVIWFQHRKAFIFSTRLNQWVEWLPLVSIKDTLNG